MTVDGLIPRTMPPPPHQITQDLVTIDVKTETQFKPDKLVATLKWVSDVSGRLHATCSLLDERLKLIEAHGVKQDGFPSSPRSPMSPGGAREDDESLSPAPISPGFGGASLAMRKMIQEHSAALSEIEAQRATQESVIVALKAACLEENSGVEKFDAQRYIELRISEMEKRVESLVAKVTRVADPQIIERKWKKDSLQVNRKLTEHASRLQATELTALKLQHDLQLNENSDSQRIGGATSTLSTENANRAANMLTENNNLLINLRQTLLLRLDELEKSIDSLKTDFPAVQQDVHNHVTLIENNRVATMNTGTVFDERVDSIMKKIESVFRGEEASRKEQILEMTNSLRKESQQVTQNVHGINSQMTHLRVEDKNHKEKFSGVPRDAVVCQKSYFFFTRKKFVLGRNHSCAS